MDAHNLLRTSGLFDQQSFFVRNGLKVTPYLEAVNLSFIFTWGGGETEDNMHILI